jgi:hypothetical protein
MPTGGGGTRLGGACLADKQAHHAILAGSQRQAPARGQVELARVPSDLDKHGGEPATAQGFLEDPQRLAWASGAHDDKLLRIEAETIETRPIGMPRFAQRPGLGDKQKRPMIGPRQARQDGDGETCGGKRIAGGIAADLMKPIAAQPTAQHMV